ncbi:MAG: T9SS type A sorting domain-containing protein [Bacteroidota bacterium]
MKKFNFAISFLFLFALSMTVQAQEGNPFVDAIYEVEVEQNVTYGVNATILPILVGLTSEAVPSPLRMDVYTPVGDSGEDRPVMFVLHTGNFLPFPDNNGTGGTRSDSTVVEVCNRLAQRGYVACAISYRLGWNPLDNSQDVRNFFLINAAYRGIQDVRTATRFLRLDAVDGENKYGIDPNKIGAWGIGTGGYIVAGLATLEDVQETFIPKFLIDLGNGMPVPMVSNQTNGNVNGTSVGIVPAGYPVLPAGDTLCYPNHVFYADGSEIPSNLNLAVNNGGALGSLSWIDENTIPWVTFHVPTDRFAPYTTGTLTVPGTGDPADPSDDFPIVEVHGGFDVHAELDELGINDIFDGVDDLIEDNYEDFADLALDRSEGRKGLFPFPNNTASESSPWDFYAEDIPTAALHPAPEPELARTYWDSIFAFAIPRACIALDLGCDFTPSSTETVLDAADLGLQLAPNPATLEVQVTTATEFPIQAIEMYDLSGRMVRHIPQVNNNQIVIQRQNLNSGMYFLKMRFEEGIVTQKVMFE